MADFLRADGMENRRLILLYTAALGFSLFMFGYLDAVFFKPSSYSASLAGFPLSREDIYYASLTLSFASICAACTLAAKIGSQAKVSARRFLLFTAGNAALFSIWLWALSWMQLSGTMELPPKPLDLWRFGPMAIYINTGVFPVIILVSFLLHMCLLYVSEKVNFLKAKAG